MNAKTKFLFILTITIFGLLCISNVSNASEVFTSGNFNYTIIDETISDEPEVVIESLNDYSIEELRIPETIDGMRVRKFAEPRYSEETGSYSYILKDTKNLKRLILEDPAFSFNAQSSDVEGITLEEVIIDRQIIDYLLSGYSFGILDKSVKIKGYGHTLVQEYAELRGFVYESIGENTKPLLYDNDGTNTEYAIGLNAYTENLVIPETVKVLNLINGKRVIVGTPLTWKDQFNINATAAIKTIRFENKEPIDILDQTAFSGLETVYGYEGTGAEVFAENLGAEFISLGKVENEKFLYDIVEDENETYIAIKGINGVKPNKVEFPEYINNLPVRVIKSKTIPNPGYKQITTVSEVVIPSTVRKVETDAFCGCNLKKLTVNSKEIEYLDSFRFKYDANYISWVDLILSAYDESGLREKFENAYKTYISLNSKTDYTTEETENVKINDENVTILPVVKETNIIDFIIKDKFPTLGENNIKVVDKDGKEKANTEKLGSKNIIKIEDEQGNILAEFTVVVPGDITGNGYARMYDAFQILKDTIIPGATLDAIDIKIRDHNGDKNVRMYDAFQFLKDSILG